jgi:hypothetical protein
LLKAVVFPKKPLNKDDLRLCLSAWAEQPKASIAVICKHVGLSQQRVSNAQQWAILGNFFNAQGLTNIGKIVLEKDPYLEATVTDWVLHLYFSLNGHGLQPQPEIFVDWGIWTYIIYDFLKENLTFTQESLTKTIAQNFPAYKAEELVRIFLKTYLQKDSISNCSFLTQNDKIYGTGNANLKNVYLVGYLLSTIWQRDFGSQESVLVNDIVGSPMGLLSVLGISENQLREQLDRLAELEIIEQRSAKPRSIRQKADRRQKNEDFYLVVRCWEDPLDLLVKAYDQDPAVPNSPLIQVLEGTFEDDEDDVPFFLSSAQTWFLNLCPQQFQFVTESTSFNPPLHLAS